MPLDSLPPSPRRRHAVTAARARWGPQRVVRLDDLTPEQRRLVLALIEAARNEKATTVSETPVVATPEVARDSQDPAA